MRPPPGISPEVFAKALQEFSNAIGKDSVFASEDDIDLYRDSYSPFRGTSEERMASAAVAPNSSAEVQAVVKIAGQYGIPLYAISTGKNLGYGGSAPVYSGSVVVDLKRMNRIIEVNDRNHYAIVEPGVSYFDLYNHIQERSLKVWIDCPDPGWGSLIGNALDHGVGYTSGRFRNHFDAHCGMEVVLPNGEILRTGMGALSNARTWPEFKNGFGPIIDGMFSQSNFGIVTKMGFWLMPPPAAYLQGSILAPRYDDLHALVDTLNLVENSGLASGMPQLASPLLGLGTFHQIVNSFYNGLPELPVRQQELIATSKIGYSNELERYGLENVIPYWEIQLSFYGPEKVVEAQWEAVCDLATEAIRNVRFRAGPVMSLPLTEAQQSQVHLQQLGIPNLEFFAYGSRAGGNPVPTSGHMGYTPVIPRTGQAIIDANRVFDEASRTIRELEVMIIGLKPFSLPTAFYERSFLYLLGMPVLDDPEQNAASIRALGELIRIGADHGWGEYRTSTFMQDEVMASYSYNNNALLRFLETLKDAVDPKGVLSPGRYGIWPKHLREKRR